MNFPMLRLSVMYGEARAQLGEGGFATNWTGERIRLWSKKLSHILALQQISEPLQRK